MGRLIREHAAQVRATVEALVEGVAALIDGDGRERLSELARVTHEREGRADDLMHEAEMALVRGALFSGARRVLIRLLEAQDEVANAAEEVMDYLLLQGVEIPELIHPLIGEMLEVIGDQAVQLEKCVDALFLDGKLANQLAESLEHAEGRVDDLERRAIARLFNLPMDLAERLLVRDFIGKLASISDRTEDLGDVVLVAVAFAAQEGLVG